MHDTVCVYLMGPWSPSQTSKHIDCGRLIDKTHITITISDDDGSRRREYALRNVARIDYLDSPR